MSDSGQSSSISQAPRIREHDRQERGDRKRRRQKKTSRRDDNSLEYLSSASSESSYTRRKSRKSERKRTKKSKKKKSKHSRRHSKSTTKRTTHDTVESNDQHFALSDALCTLFDRHPDFSADLPIMLIRMAKGTSFDLRQMPDTDAAFALECVFKCMNKFGVEKQQSGNCWEWKNPAKRDNTNELILIRVVRAVLDQIGFTFEAVNKFESTQELKLLPKPIAVNDTSSYTTDDATERQIEFDTVAFLDTFKSGNLAQELPSLLQLILDGEMIAIDGLPDASLRESLESLLRACGLEKSAMETDEVHDADKVDESENTEFGYGLPEQGERKAITRITSVLKICSSATLPPGSQRPVKGPMMNPGVYGQQAQNMSESSSDDEGPLQLGMTDPKVSGPSKEFIKLKAARRAKELACARDGIELDPSDGNAREEWMLVPGKFDFLSSIKSGQPIRNRTFEAKSKAELASAGPAVAPEVRAEIQAIRQAAEAARGPSLMDQHRQAKKEAAAKAKGQDTSWTWSRDNDLDSGRRVDKDALGMILGGAGSDLKQKFQSSI